MPQPPRIDDATAAVLLILASFNTCRYMEENPTFAALVKTLLKTIDIVQYEHVIANAAKHVPRTVLYALDVSTTLECLIECESADSSLYRTSSRGTFSRLAPHQTPRLAPPLAHHHNPPPPTAPPVHQPTQVFHCNFKPPFGPLPPSPWASTLTRFHIPLNQETFFILPRHVS